MGKIQPPSSTLRIVTDASAQTSTSSSGEFFIPFSKLSIMMRMAIDALTSLSTNNTRIRPAAATLSFKNSLCSFYRIALLGLLLTWTLF